ncbi:terpene synthase family protein [Streptomyces sp. NPDC001941]|uniref:terpene synthase family protein n=1 Tax=Streptomyces sp. NPDC001941 TaxID=3154659 RepID=UPI003329FF96
MEYRAAQRQTNMPELDFPFPTHVSGHYLYVRPRIHDWFIAKNVLHGQRLQRFLLGDYTLFVAMMHAGSDESRLERLTRYYILWFAMEEYCESLWLDDTGKAGSFLAAFIDYLHNGKRGPADPWLDAYAEAVEDLLLSPRQRALLVTWMTDWLRGEQRVAAYKGEPREEFMRDRFHTIGQHLAFRLFTQYELALDLPAAIAEHPEAETFIWTLVRAGSWHSDVLTLEAEESRGELVNTVHVIARRPGATREHAIETITRRFHDDCRLTTRQARALRRAHWAGDHQHDLARWVDALMGCSAGFLSWNKITDRYAVALQ